METSNLLNINSGVPIQQPREVVTQRVVTCYGDETGLSHTLGRLCVVENVIWGSAFCYGAGYIYTSIFRLTIRESRHRNRVREPGVLCPIAGEELKPVIVLVWRSLSCVTLRVSHRQKSDAR